MDMDERVRKVSEAVDRRVPETGAFPTREDVVKRLAGPERLTVYVGIDPTGTELHLGHTIPLLLLGDLAGLGHEAVLLIGDFTARIGDPTGKSAARVALTAEQIQQNMATYLDQAHTILPKDSFRVAYNSEWLGALTMEQILKLTGLVTVQQMLQRDMFQERLKEQKPIYLNEFLYPLMQGYDSVALRTDGEVGGNDQTFNMLVGRELERELLGKDKFVLATRLLVDAETGKKMSKSEGALIAINDSPQEIRRKVLEVDDTMIRTLFELCTRVPYGEIDGWQKEGAASAKPREAKERLADVLVGMYHGGQAIDRAREAVEITTTGALDKVLKESGLAASMAEAKRLVEQRGVLVNGQTAERWDTDIKSGDEIRVGKGKFVKVK